MQHRNTRILGVPGGAGLPARRRPLAPPRGVAHTRPLRPSRWMAAPCLLALCLVGAARGAHAQSAFSPLEPVLSGIGIANPAGDGLALYDLSLFSQYYSTAWPAFSLSAAQPLDLGYDVAAGVRGTLGWRHTGARTHAGMVYTGSYAARARYNAWNSNDHELSLNLERQLGRAWSLRLTGDGSVRTLDQSLFLDPQLIPVAAQPASFDDLAAAMLRGAYSDTQLASMLTGLPVVATPAETLIFGSRLISSGAAATLSYARSPRWRLFWGVGAGHMQALPGGDGLPGNRPALNHSFHGNAEMGVSHALSARTELTATATAGRQFSNLSDRYAVMGSLTLSRALTRQWFASLEAGGGTYFNRPAIYASDLAAGSPSHYLGGATLSRRSFAQTWQLSVRRALLDSYGAGARSSVVVDLAWRWSRPGSPWFLMASGDEQSMGQSAVNALHAWRLQAGLGRRLGWDLVWQTGYSYMDYRLSGIPPQGLLARASIQAVRTALVWSPRRPN